MELKKTKNGTHYIDNVKFIDLIRITGKCQIVKLPKPILDKEEKEYLSAIIKPFRNRVIYIGKCYLGENEYIEICLKHFMDNDDCEILVLPEFEKGTMYKGMKTRKRYALEDLEL